MLKNCLRGLRKPQNGPRKFFTGEKDLKKSPWIILVLSLLILVAIAGLSYAASLTDDQMKTLGRIPKAVVQWVHPGARYWIFILTGAGALLQAFEKLTNIFAFRQDRAKAVLDLLVKDLLENDPRQNRCTLFRARRGYRLWLHFIPRILHQDDHLTILRDVIRIRPWGLYLYVYARASKAKNAKSCVAFRVYRNKERDCEGFAGKVWMEGEFITLRDLDAPDPQSLKNRTKGKSKLTDLGPGNKVVKYARATNITNLVQLRARERVANHFVGMSIEDKEGNKWGVLLVDSIKPSCPFPTGVDGEQFAEDFQTYARVLAAILT